MTLDVHIADGKSIDEALTAFRESVNQPDNLQYRPLAASKAGPVKAFAD